MKQEQCDDSASMYVGSNGLRCHSVTPDRRAGLCEWNGTEVLDTGQLMTMLSECFAVNLGDHQVVLGVYHSVKKKRVRGPYGSRAGLRFER
jgi:hypothetical protein